MEGILRAVRLDTLCGSIGGFACVPREGSALVESSSGFNGCFLSWIGDSSTSDSSPREKILVHSERFKLIQQIDDFRSETINESSIKNNMTKNRKN